MQKGNKQLINSWAFYDWANSVYPLVITTAIFPIFYANATTGADGSDIVHLFGTSFRNTELKSYTLSLSFLLVALMSPFLSGIADHYGRKKRFMQFFCYLGSASCALMYFFSKDHLGWSMFTFMMATIGFWGSLVFYNAFLPEIAEPKDQDRVSAKGFSLGYVGSSILLILNLVLIMNHEAFGIPTKGEATRLAFVAVGVWWFGFAQITFRHLPDHVYHRVAGGNPFSSGFQELRGVWRQMKTLRRLRRYLYAFFVFNMGVQTVMLVAVDFGKKEIAGMPDSGMIVSILIIQFIAIAGSQFFSWLSGRSGNLRALAVAVTIWAGICIWAYFIRTPMDFYITAAVVGLVMGGIQSLSRSTYSKFLPETHDHASYFSFYDVCEKVGIMLGTFVYGFIEGFTGSMRNSVLMLVAFFVIGLVLLAFVPKPAKSEA